MPIEFLKKARKKNVEALSDISGSVSDMIREIESGGERQVESFSREFDDFSGPIVVTDSLIRLAENSVADYVKEDIHYAKENVERFASDQLSSMNDFQSEIRPGLVAGQKSIPVNSAGCYVPGGRYSHIASAIMTVTTAKVAGVKNITVCSPPRNGEKIPNEIIYAAKLCGADKRLT